MATRDVFSEEEAVQLRRFAEINRAELIRYFTLAPADEVCVRKFRGSANMHGAAVQLRTLPWPGFVPDEVAAAPAAAVASYLGWRVTDELEWKQLQEFLVSRAMEHDSPKLLFRLGCDRPPPRRSQHRLRRWSWGLP